MQSKIDEFEKNWMDLDIDGDLSDIGINENAVVVKAIFSGKDGEFEYNLKRYSAIDSIPEIFYTPEIISKLKNFKIVLFLIAVEYLDTLILLYCKA